MDAFPIGKRSQVVMTAHQFADPAPEPGVHFQQTLDLRGSVFICAVKTAAERMESLPDLLRGGKKLICQNVIGSRVVIASAVITQIVRRPFFHQIIPFFSHGHAENNRFGNTCCIHGSYQGRKAVRILCEVQKMQVGINNVVSWLCFHPADINVAIIDHGKPPLVNLSFSISIITVVEPVKNKKRQAVICK